MDLGPLEAPATDPAPIVELLRGSYGTELLVAATAHFNVFGLLDERPRGFDELRAVLGLEIRPMHVLLTALRAMKLVEVQADGRAGDG